MKKPLPNWAAPAPLPAEPWRKPSCLICDAPNPPFGEGCDLLANKPGVWFCAEHLPPDFLPSRSS